MNVNELVGTYLVHKLEGKLYFVSDIDKHSKVVHISKIEDGSPTIINYESLRIFYPFGLQSRDRFIFLEHECMFRRIYLAKNGELCIEVFNVTRQHADIIDLGLLLDNNYNYEYV
tara:strand:+ start:3242 stop:3586 length:345 start_codon:yes stop_codon:yes gene_type:complete